MKQLTKQAVKAAMDLLISANGQTTTLEIKGHLRELDFDATQAQVSQFMSEIESESSDYAFTANGTYRTYTFVSDVEIEDEDDDIWEDEDGEEEEEELTVDDFTSVSGGSFLDVIDEDDEDDEDEIDAYNAYKITSRTQTTSTDPIRDAINDVNTSTTLIGSKSTPTQVVPQGTYFTINHALTSVESLRDKDTWIVKVTENHDVYKRDGIKLVNAPILTFDSELTSDKVRSRYASIIGVKIQDVRAKRANKYDI